MGVPKFYRWISERYPCLSEVVREYQIPEFDNLYLDMNGIIHNCSHPNDDDVHFRISEETIFKDIFRYIEFLFQMIKPRKVFFMAIDGVAPRAKMNQQRGRRFRSAKEAEDREKEAMKKGEVLPTEKRFDSNCITPGTEFMDRLHQHLKYFVAHKISTDDLWRDVKVVLSGHETPGEGEHKIMDFIRFEKSQPEYDPNTRHCLYGLDADLMMLGMCSHEPHFSLLREEVKFNNRSKNNKRDSNPEAITFHLLHLSLFREYIDHEFEVLKTTLPFEYNLENIIDDWVLMGFLVGNDFIPHIPHFHINKNSLLQLYDVYKQVLPTLDGYLNENGKLNLSRFQKYLNEVTKIDIEHFNDTYADLKYFESKTGRKLIQKKLEDTSAFFETDGAVGGFAEPKEMVKSDDNEDNESDANDSADVISDSSESDEDDMFMQEFKSHKRDYYMTKLNYKEVDESVLKEQAYEYIRALQWNLHYYYNGCMSWGWYYPHHYAPYISDVNNFGEIDLNFEMGEPFKPFEQLLAVLPSASKELLPKAFEPLVTNPLSELIDYYPEDFETDQNEKQQAWEAVVLIPFIDEKRLLTAVRNLEKNLSYDEIRRNSHGPHLIYTYSQQTTEPLKSPNPLIFPDIVTNHSICQTLDTNGFRMPIEKIHKGLCEGVRLDVYIRGFPTLRHVPHDIVLSKEKVRVFEQASNSENMMLILKNQEQPPIEEVADEYVNETVFINWPHLLEAKVIKVSDPDFKYYINNGQMVCTEPDDKEYKETSIRINARVKSYRERWGVVVSGNLKNREDNYSGIVIHALPVTGRKYVTGADGKMNLEKEYSTQTILCPIETTVTNLEIFEHKFSKFETFEEIFAKDAKCFPIDNPHYGSIARVIESLPNEGLVRVEVFPQFEPDLREIQQRIDEIIYERYMPNHVLANRLQINKHLCSRMLGTIFLKNPDNDNRRNNRINIGLNLKFNAKNEEIPGFSIKRDDTWLFSEKVVNIMNEYFSKFPFIFERLSSCVEKDYFTIEDLIPGEDKHKTLEKLVKWLRSLEPAQERRQKCNAEILDEFVVQAIEDVINTHIVRNCTDPARKASKVFQKEMSPAIETYRPNQLYRPIHHLGYALPDSRATFELFDRVVNVRSGISVPLGAKGIIIGKHIDTNNEVNTLFDIVFDEAFVGGTKLRCTPGKGFKLSPANLINITFGLKLSGKFEQYVSPGQPIQSRPQQNHQNWNRNNYRDHNRDQNSGRINFNHNQRTSHSQQSFGRNPIAVNAQTALSIQTLNHSKTSPFQSPKHENQPKENSHMEQMWKLLTNAKNSDNNMLPKPSFASITAQKSLPQNQKQVIQPKDIQNKSIPKPKNQKNITDNRRPENVQNVRPFETQNKSLKTNVKLVETYRTVLSNACTRYYSQPPRMQTLSTGPMQNQSLRLTLPDGRHFHTYINAHESMDNACEFVAYEALKYINNTFNANINLECPERLLSSPSFLVPDKSSPNRPRITESSLPRPPTQWIATRARPPTVRPITIQNIEIPESFVAHNERELNRREVELQKANSSARINTNTSANKDRNITPKRLFDTRNDNLVNAIPNQNQRPFQNKNNRKVQNDMMNDNQGFGRRPNNPRQRAVSHGSAFENQFVPLQVARNNQSHRTHTTSLSQNERSVIEINSNSSSEVEILTPETVVRVSNPFKNSTDEIEILTPESLTKSTPKSSSSGQRQQRKTRLGAKLD